MNELVSEDSDWSTPSLHTAASFQPPLDPAAAFELQWSDTVYVGRRGRRVEQLAEQQDRAAAPEPDAPESQSRVLAASRTMAIANLTSRITGFLRSSLIVAALGSGLHSVGDAYNLANNFPNMVYELLLGGVLSSVLIPLLIGAQEKDDDGGVAYTQRLLSLATAALAAFTLVAVACAPLIAAPFVTDHSQRSVATLFATLLLPEIFFYGLGAMYMAVLNVRHSYGPGAWSSVLNNVVMIVTVLVFWALPGPATLNPSTITTPQVLVMGIGTSLGIAAQALVLIPSLRRSGFRWEWRFRARDNEAGRIREVGRLAVWVFGYVVASQIGVSAVAAIGVRRGAFTIFTNADLLIQMPYGILVVSLLTALMPRLSRAAAQGRTRDVVDDLGLGARLAALTLVPITALMMALGPVLCVVLFGYHQMTIAEARDVGTALAWSAFGLFPFALVMLQLRVFYAMRDGRTPTLINIAMVVTKVAIIVICDHALSRSTDFGRILTAATSASYVVGAVIGQIALTRRLGSLHFSPVVRTLAQSVLAAVGGGIVAWALVRVSEHLLGSGHTGSLLSLVTGGILGLAVFTAAAWRLRIPELRQLRSLVAR